MSTKLQVAFSAVLLTGGAAIALATAIPAHEIQSLSSAITAKTTQSTVTAQWGDLLRRHAATGLSIHDAEIALTSALREMEAAARRDFEAVAAEIKAMLAQQALMREMLRAVRAEETSLKDLLDGDSSKLSIAHGDKVAAAAQRRNDAVRRLQEALAAQHGLDPTLQLRIQEAAKRAAESSLYVSKIAAALNDQIKAIIAILIG